MPNHYHYIITGAGCAGSSLLAHMMRNPFFDDKKILVIDQSPKTANDHTWCFWEKNESIFEPIIHHRWQQLDFYSNELEAHLSIEPYTYKMIRAIDLYTSVRDQSMQHTNIEWRYGRVQSMHTEQNAGVVQLDDERITADFIFNSILFDPDLVEEKQPALLQHFKGWFIETKAPVFDPSRATFMDFRVPQQEGTTFAYVLPTSSTTALVEYTLFTKNILQQEAYEQGLRDYLSSVANIEAYNVVHEEFGIIPMTARRFPLQEGRVVNMGIAGGQVKASSGYAFRFIQKRVEVVLRELLRGGCNFSRMPFSDRKFHFYDKVLLTVLANRKMSGPDIFSRIFRHNPPALVLQFLDNETTLTGDLRIMRSVPSKVFLPAAFAALW